MLIKNQAGAFLLNLNCSRKLSDYESFFSDRTSSFFFSMICS